MRSTPTDTDTDTSLSTALINVGEPAPSVEGAPSFQPIPVATGSVPADQTSPGPPQACTASSITSDVAIAALTDGLGSVAALRKAEKALEAADYVRDAERAVAAAREVGGPAIHVGKQGRHIPSHSNFQPGRSVLHADPEVLAKKAGTGEPIGRMKVGEAGSKERVVFGEMIGEYVDETGRAVPTSVGIIHYSKDGIHIVPGRPK